MGGIHCDNEYRVHCLDDPHPFSPLTLSLPHLKQLQEIFSFYFIKVCEVHQPYSLTLNSFVHPPPHTSAPTTLYFTVLYFIINF
jgi:hypothetical protein